jgi:hypothetical protein
MATDEVEAVLANWIEQARAPGVRLPDGVTPSAWAATRFAKWWRSQASDRIDDAERAALAVDAELMRLGGWQSFGEALHELIHVRDAISDLRGLMRLPVDTDA